MRIQLPKWLKPSGNKCSGAGKVNPLRRRLLGGLATGAGLVTLGNSTMAKAAETDDEELRFPGDPPEHKVVYQFSKADPAYHKAVLFSVGDLLRKWGDNIGIVVVGIGPGLDVLVKDPAQPVVLETRERISSLAQYGVEFHACGNTMKSQKLEAKDMLSFAKIVEVGASDLMELQEQGYAYISW